MPWQYQILLLSVFTLIETICPRICSKSRTKSAKIPLPLDVRRSKTSLLKLSNSLFPNQRNKQINKKKHLRSKINYEFRRWEPHVVNERHKWDSCLFVIFVFEVPACFKYTEASKACVRQNQFKCLFRKKTNPQHPRLCSEERKLWSRDKSCHQISIYWFKEITWVKQWRSKKPNVCTKSCRDSLFPAKVIPINHRRNILHYPGSFAYYFNPFWEIAA